MGYRSIGSQIRKGSFVLLSGPILLQKHPHGYTWNNVCLSVWHPITQSSRHTKLISPMPLLPSNGRVSSLLEHGLALGPAMTSGI